MNKKVLLFAPQGFEDIELAAFTDIFGWTRVLKEVEHVDLVIAAFKILLKISEENGQIQKSLI